MHNDKLIIFLKRWREIEARQIDLDYAKSVLARDIRGEFTDGVSGDQAFVNWCGLELGMSVGKAQDLLSRAKMSKRVPDQNQWNRLGGFKGIRPVESLPEPEQRKVITQALGAKSTIESVLRGRGLIPNEPKKPDHKSDIEILANYVLKQKRVPRSVRVIAERYK